MTSVECHEALARALDRGIDSAAFFLWLRVDGEVDRPSDDEVRSFVQQAREWLNGLDVDAVKSDHLPTLRLAVDGGEVELTAIPKKPAARGSSGPVVGNPVPPRAFWS